MKLQLTLDKAIHGFWDGGAKSRFTWEIDGGVKSDKQGEFVKVGSWDANSWFCVAKGKTDRQTLSYAKAHIKALMARRNITATYEYIN
jgi:hypothetical protein